MKSRPQFKVEIAGKSVRLGIRTIVMGILNVTPDSFSDGGLYMNASAAAGHGLEMVRQGADWIDVGGESTRPGSIPVSAEEELRRILPVIRAIRRRMPALPISVDTTKARVADEALRAGANIVNDVSGLRFDPELAAVARRYGAPLILMHLRGRPATMQRGPFARSITRSLSRGLGWSIRRALSAGMKRSSLIIDPGLGFGKTRVQNFQILARLNILQSFRLPILVGASRKSFIRAAVAGEVLARQGHSGVPVAASEKKRNSGAKSRRFKAEEFCAPAWPSRSLLPAQLDFGDAAAAAAAVLAGAHIVRVHSIPAVLPAVRVADAIFMSRES